MWHISKQAKLDPEIFLLYPFGEPDAMSHYCGGELYQDQTVRLWTMPHAQSIRFLDLYRVYKQHINALADMISTRSPQCLIHLADMIQLIHIPPAELVQGALTGKIWCQRWLQYLNEHKEGL